ncbi:nucleotidyltransferase [Ruminococcaceae bacterium OttesenSCG-928-A11]|nr:nucleotidyltransferase [Ruminococcaceae bacterium OttesenSCG-928-A11]
MEKPVLVVLAAGMGSRYGGLKQIDPVGPSGEVIIDYSIYDAKKAGFEKVIFIIKHEIEADFKEVIGSRIKNDIEVEYVFQELDQLPAGYSLPEGRVKPWGTTHAVLAAKDKIKGPFAVINADDYYGPEAYKVLYDFLSAERPADGKDHFAMVGYLIENTVTDKGTVARGVCQADEGGYLTGIVERLKVAKHGVGARFTEDDGQSWTDLPAGTLVSMNFWGFDPGFLRQAEVGFPAFLDKNLPVNPQKCEYLLPSSVDEMIRAGTADVKVLQSGDVWYGVTYKEDKPGVVAAIAEKHKAGQYPSPLWADMGTP